MRVFGVTDTGDISIARRPGLPAPPSKDGPRANEEIQADPVRLVDADGEMVGVIGLQEAIDMAVEVGLDLVEVSPNADPPVCKILDYGKYKYEAQKKANEARKKQKIIEVKEIKMRPGIDDHDYEVKMKAVRRFLDDGDKVKMTIRFRGREMAHQELGLKVLERVREEVGEIAKVEQHPRPEGRLMTMVIAPR
ncbi:translation initiation factor IF-3 [Thalassospiraceae bacterium LMO-JJ14]|nr:translation initiation factor IF-3 [Thalassospiraceae bacterium LMO-JJ14]